VQPEPEDFDFYSARHRLRQNPKSRKAKDLARNEKIVAVDYIRVKLRIAL
jgi:hypothetical protein